MNTLYEKLNDMFKQGRTPNEMRLDSRGVTRIIRGEHQYTVKMWQTNIIIAHQNGHIVLDSGGWWGRPTTRKRFNETLGKIGVYIFQSKKMPYLRINKEIFPFTDGMELQFELMKGYSVEGFDATAKKEATKEEKATATLIKKISEYAKNFAEKFVNNKISPPFGGDCWCCVANDKLGNDHLLSHIKEKYYVPTLLINARNENLGDFSIYVNTIIHNWLCAKKVEDNLNLTGRAIKKAIEKYLMNRLIYKKEVA